jgi:hypothetical protein
MVLQELEESGAPWSIEHGGRHFKLIVFGRLAGILPWGGKSSRRSSDLAAELNTRAQVRRIIKEARA